MTAGTCRSSSSSAGSLEGEVRSRRLWYHDIELTGGVRTRFPEDYVENPVLERVDQSCTALERMLTGRLPGGVSGGSVLDAGCADGRFVAWACRGGAKRVVGIERNQYNYEHAAFVVESLKLRGVELRCGSIEARLGEESYDVILFLGLMYHLVNPLGVLHALRARCRGHLFVTAAVDLDDADGSAMSRLDLYAEGAHGLWSFNLPMVRRLLSTAGWSIEHEEVQEAGGGSRHVFLHAVPGAFAEHHIFADRIDQVWPVHVDRRRERVIQQWTELARTIRKPVVLFGAGTHTPWLLERIAEAGAELESVRVEAIVDDRAHPGQRLCGIPVIRPDELAGDGVGAVVISSWHQGEVLRRRARVVFGPDMPIISFDG